MIEKIIRNMKESAFTGNDKLISFLDSVNSKELKANDFKYSVYVIETVLASDCHIFYKASMIKDFTYRCNIDELVRRRLLAVGLGGITYEKIVFDEKYSWVFELVKPVNDNHNNLPPIYGTFISVFEKGLTKRLLEIHGLKQARIIIAKSDYKEILGWLRKIKQRWQE